MSSRLHEIENRAPEKWIKRAAEHLCVSCTDANIGATLPAVSILKNALEDVTASRGLR